MAPSRKPEFALLGGDTPEDEAAEHAFRTSPVFTGDALGALGSDVLPQRAVYGSVLAQNADGFPSAPSSPILYINTNTPFSGLVCGLQGTGKSHSTSVLLESCLMSDFRLGTLPEPLSALVFHFDTAAGGGAVQPCEAAYLSTLDAQRGGGAVAPMVTVLVLPSNLQAMRKVYAGLPAVRVEPLHFSPEDISGERLLAMMKVEENGQMPLYMEAVMTILRSMEDTFDYTLFREELKAQSFSGTQKSMLNLRLSLLDSCLKGGSTKNRVSTHFGKGHLTIIDLSSPFMDGSSVCGFFDLILGLFVEADVKASGKLVVLDEAHKYLTDAQSGSSSRLTESLLTIIRQYRHLGTRVIISTQEPTVVPSKFLALCSFVIAHRFQSPEWLRLLTKHVSIPKEGFDELYAKIVKLRTGQAIMFAASGISVRGSDSTPWHSESDSGIAHSDDAGTVEQLGAGYLHVQSRLRVTRDGGHSVLAVRDPTRTTRVGLGSAGVPEDWGTPGESWRGRTDRQSSASTGGSPAPTGVPAEAAAPPAPHPRYPTTNAFTQATTLAVIRRPASPLTRRSPSPSHDSTSLSFTTAADSSGDPEAQTPEADSSSLTGGLEKLGPLVEFLREKHDLGIAQVLVKTVRKHFDQDHRHVYGDDFQGALNQAIRAGIVEFAPKKTGNAKILLKPGAQYTSKRVVHLKDQMERLAPLVTYLQDQADKGFHEIKVSTIERRLGMQHDAIADAEAAGIVEIILNQLNPKVRLAQDTLFVF